MLILDEISRANLVTCAHKEAHRYLLDALESAEIVADEIQEANSKYRSWFVTSLVKQFNRFKQNHCKKDTSIKSLLERLSEKGVTEYSVTTPPLCLAVRYKGTTISFTYNYEGATAAVDGFEIGIKNWDEDIVELIDAIYEECQESKIFAYVHTILSRHMTEKVQQGILISTAMGLMRAKMKDIDYEIISQSAIGDEVVIRFSTSYGIFMIVGPIEEFEKKIEDKMHEIKYSMISNKRSEFE